MQTTTGTALTWKNDGTAVALSGSVIKIGVFIGVLATDIHPGETGAVIVAGVHRLPKTTGEAWRIGDRLAYNESSGAFALGGGGIGCVAAQAAEADEESGLVLLNAGAGASGGGPVDWTEIENKPADLVRDAAYQHTDNNYTTTEKDKLAGLENYDDTALSARVSANETAIADRYTKAQTDQKIAEGIATVDSEHFHPVTVLPDAADAKENHEYILIEYEQDGVTIKSKKFYLFYDGAYHEDRAAGVSLDGYATEQYVDAGLADKAAQSSVVALENTAEDLRIANEATQTELTDFKVDYLIDMASKQTMAVINWQYEFLYAELLEMLKSGGAVVEWGNQTYMPVVGFEDKVVEDVRTINVFVHNTASTDGISLYWFTWTVAEADKETVKMSPDSSYHEVTAVGVPWVAAQLSYKQDTLVSGTNIKTVNGNSLLGEGNLVIAGGDGATLTITTEAGVTEATISQDAKNLSFMNLPNTMYVGGLTENGFEVPMASYVNAELAKKQDYTIIDIANFNMSMNEFEQLFYSDKLIYIKDGTLNHLVTDKYTWDLMPETEYELSYIEGDNKITYQFETSDDIYYRGRTIKPVGYNLAVGEERLVGTYREAGLNYNVYSKIIKIDALPSTAGTTTYDHGISNIKQILQVYGFCSNGFVMNAPRQSLQDNISVYQVSKTTGNQKISIEVGKDRSSLSAYVCLVYAKNN